MVKYRVHESNPICLTRKGIVLDVGKAKIGICKTIKYDKHYYKKYTCTDLYTGCAIGCGGDTIDECLWESLFLIYSPLFKEYQLKYIKQESIKVPVNKRYYK